MWLLPALLLIPLVLLVTGCSRVVYPGDGRLVIVEIDPELEETKVNGYPLGTIIRNGIRYWDTAGARLRTRDQLSDQELRDIDNAPRLRVRGNRGVVGSNLSREHVAFYHPDSGDIEIFLDGWHSNESLAKQIGIVAHEVGHAIGLNHVADTDSIMSAPPSSRRDLSDSDLQEHARVW